MSHAASSGTAGTPNGGPDKLRPEDFALRRVPPATAAERRLREDGMARALEVGAAPYRDAEGRARYVVFKEANRAAVEPWRRDPRARRGYRRTQDLRKAAGQLIGQPGDQIEIAKRLGVLHHQEGSDIEGAAARGLYDAIWSREHVYHSFTVPRRYGLHLMDTGRVAAVAEEEARRLQAEDPKARGGFWVRDRRSLGLIYVMPNADPEAEAEEEFIFGSEGNDIVVGQASAPPSPPAPKPAVSPQPPQGSPVVGNPATSAQATQAPALATADDYFALLRQGLATREGGVADRPLHEDPGGVTNQGVTQDTLDLLHKNKPLEYGHYPTDPRVLTDSQIETILRKEFFDPLHIWQTAQIPDLQTAAPELPAQIFDIGVLHGIDYAGRVVQLALFKVMGIDLRVMRNGKLDYDGVIGPATRNALAQAVAAGKIVEINNLMVDLRKAELNTKGHKKFNRGWLGRTESFRIQPTRPPTVP